MDPLLNQILVNVTKLKVIIIPQILFHHLDLFFQGLIFFHCFIWPILYLFIPKKKKKTQRTGTSSL
jgi:hypothetical protein